jgi:dihydrodipicolinate synthase/N-acetylneuraminate lyase
MSIDPHTLLTPKRKITGISAVLLPFQEDGAIDWDGFSAHLLRTAAAGLTPAVNMDTGYVNLLSPDQRRSVLRGAKEVLGERTFAAGAFVDDRPGDRWNPAAYLAEIEQIQRCGGIPVIFQSYGLTSFSSPRDQLAAYSELGRHCAQFIAFELGEMFAAFGKIYDMETFAGLLEIPQCIGAKHSSLSRRQEWARLFLRNERRPEFKIFTGNDLAIDMVMYGSDYLLGISTFAPDFFARRDALWEASHPAFYELNDWLQYLGFFAFRAPVPAYKHSAAQFLKLRGWIASDAAHPLGLRRPETDLPVLRGILDGLLAFD